jgi:hypothetical protein
MHDLNFALHAPKRCVVCHESFEDIRFLLVRATPDSFLAPNLELCTQNKPSAVISDGAGIQLAEMDGLHIAP